MINYLNTLRANSVCEELVLCYLLQRGLGIIVRVSLVAVDPRHRGLKTLIGELGCLLGSVTALAYCWSLSRLLTLERELDWRTQESDDLVERLLVGILLLLGNLGDLGAVRCRG